MRNCPVLPVSLLLALSLFACAAGPGGNLSSPSSGKAYAMRLTQPAQSADNRVRMEDLGVVFSFALDRYGFVVDVRNESPKTIMVNWEESLFVGPSGEMPLVRPNAMGSRNNDQGQTKIKPKMVVSEYLAVFQEGTLAKDPDKSQFTPWVGMDPVGLYQSGRLVSKPILNGALNNTRVRIVLSLVVNDKVQSTPFEFAVSGDTWPAMTPVDGMRIVCESRAYDGAAFAAIETSREEKVHRFVRDLLQNSVDTAIREPAARLLGKWADPADLPFLVRMKQIESNETVKATIVEAIGQVERR